MIYCVVPEALADDLYDKLVAYYANDDNVTVIVDRRQSDRRARGGEESAPAHPETEQQRQVRDRRRARVPGEFPDVDPEAGDAAA